MFKSIKLEYFRKVEDDTTTFSAGLNVIRGSNEASKTTRLEAIAYAMFGARALREPLSEVVTYGHKESELKVALEFELNSVLYTIKRGKSGAECAYANQRVTGQTEVTKFVESLLGASADTAAKMMLAKQSSVAGALGEGPSGPVKLIETLADFELITMLVDLVQNKLPSGSTRILESQIEELSKEAAEEVQDTTAEVRARLAEADAAVQQQDVAVGNARSNAVDPAPVALAIQRTKSAQVSRQNLQAQLDRINERLIAVEVPPDGSAVKIAEYTAKKAEQATAKVAMLAKADLAKLGAVHYSYKTEEEHAADVVEATVSESNLRRDASLLDVDIAMTTAAMITETACGLCGKVLTDVPEVQQKNAVTAAKLERLQEEKRNLADALEMAVRERARLKIITDDNIRCKLAYAKCGQFIKVRPTTTPAGYEWVGPTEVPEGDFDALLAAENKKQVLYAAAIATQTQLTIQRVVKQHEVDAAPIVTDAEIEALQDQEAYARSTQTTLQDHLNLLQKLTQDQRALESALKQELAVMAEAQKQVDRAKVQLASAVANLAEQNSNNILISKMRAARPRIADRLWSIVLSSVSSYFSSVRGTASVVTRTDNGFQVNGRPVGGLSGSTQDALGLAIRIALTKTFLPNARFLVLDEVAAGMDDTRETALLGLLASCGMDQVILVTHSSLADAFSSNVITL